MTAVTLRIVEPGVAATLQDLGRFGRQRDGVPTSGALDAEGLRLANALVNAPANQAALEFRFVGPTVEAVGGSVRLALAGADAAMRLRRAGDGDEETVASWRGVTLWEGDQLRIGALRNSATAYLAVAGGLAVAPVLGSASTFLRGGFGGFQGRALAAGDHLPLSGPAPDQPELALPTPPPPDREGHARMRVVLGPQDDYVTEASVASFLSEIWTISKDADRMGYRLDGPALTHRDGADIVSDGIVSGAVQVPGAGRPIILLADSQTSGGYPKIATVVSADLPALGRLGPGASLRFEAVSASQGAAIAREKAAALDAMIATIRPWRGDGVDLDALYRENLITSVVGDD